MYQVLKQNEGVKLPDEALYIIRYHSLYPWHDQGAYAKPESNRVTLQPLQPCQPFQPLWYRYAELESDRDRQMKGWVKLFNQHDLYTKKNTHFSAEKLEEMRQYYDGLIKKYLPERLLF